MMGVKEMTRDQTQKVDLDRTKDLLIQQLKAYIPEYNSPSMKIDQDGRIDIELLGYKFSATPRIVRLWGDEGVMYYFWKFFVIRDSREMAVGGFYLDYSGNIYDYGTGAFNGAPSKRLGDVMNSYLAKNILADLHASLCESELLQP